MEVVGVMVAKLYGKFERWVNKNYVTNIKVLCDNMTRMMDIIGTEGVPTAAQEDRVSLWVSDVYGSNRIVMDMNRETFSVQNDKK